jgi:immunity protein, SdpI family
MTRAYWISSVLVAASAMVALWSWFALPEGAGVPINYLGLDGHRHAIASRAAVWLLPFVALMVLAGMRRAARHGVAPAAEAFEATLIGVTGVLLVAQATLIGRALRPDFNVMGPVALAVGVLLLALGNVLGKARHNALVGVRTPWTLADARVWDKTHRFVGRGMVAGGLALIVLAFVLRDGNALGAAIAACAAVPPLAGIVWSRTLYRRAHRS